MNLNLDSNDRDLPALPRPSPRLSFKSRSTSLSDRRTTAASSLDSNDSLYPDDRLQNLFQKLTEQLQVESQRADDAERKVREVTEHLKAVNDARLLALRDAAKANEELKLYKIQLDVAQREIFRAQDVIEAVDRQRFNAEKEAAKLRTRTRQLNQTIMIQAAHEEAWKMGLQEGLDRGREHTVGEYTIGNNHLAAAMERIEDDYFVDESGSFSSGLSEHVYPVRPPPSAPSVASRTRSQSRASIAPIPVPLPTPRAQSIAPSIHPAENIRPISIRNVQHSPHMSINGLPPAEHIRPISIQRSPHMSNSALPPVEDIRPIIIHNVQRSPHMPNGALPPDNLIPSLDGDRIRLPPPFEFSRHVSTPEPPPSPQLQPMSDSSQEPLPIPPRSKVPHRRRGHHRRHSSSGSNSSTLSQLDIINDPHNTGLRTPMTMIPEVQSSYSGSPNPPSVYDGSQLRHQRSTSDTSFRHPPSISRPPTVIESDRRSQVSQAYERPQSRASRATSTRDLAPSLSKAGSQTSWSQEYNINVEPPSRTHSHRTESIQENIRTSPAMSTQLRLPDVAGPTHQTYAPSNAMPGDYPNTHFAPQPSNLEPPQMRINTGWGASSSRANDDDAVSSAISGDTLTTPPAKYSTLEGDWSGASASVAHMPVLPSDELKGNPGPSGSGWGEDAGHAPGTSNTNTKKKKKKTGR